MLHCYCQNVFCRIETADATHTTIPIEEMRRNCLDEGSMPGGIVATGITVVGVSAFPGQMAVSHFTAADTAHPDMSHIRNLGQLRCLSMRHSPSLSGTEDQSTLDDESMNGTDWIILLLKCSLQKL